ncbi:S1C family serine protease [Zhihengliuella flava]|uniref:Serine protease PepD n=1 Tax=Zhihengliuella flava TaxID=1285193 RepID=A0A931DEY1_9MICC|nr:trypsin-like peptidase domain-containing protein [Zhihengliuella flava]MBG6085590.1 putative serine protease PepD [Zhihengliuella flava]
MSQYPNEEPRRDQGSTGGAEPHGSTSEGAERPASEETGSATEPLPVHPPRYGGYGSQQSTPGGSGAPTAQAPSYTGTYQYGQTGDGHSFYGPSVPPQRKKSRRFGAPTLVLGMVLAAAVGAGSAVGADYLMGQSSPAAVTSQSGGQQTVINNPENVTAVSAAAAKASPSVVTIEASTNSSGGSGSGIILDDEGHILTNTHVVTLGGETANPNLSVRTADGQVHQAQIVGTDPLSDLAVIKIEAEGLTPAELGSSAELNVGDTAVAIGAPLGLSGTVTDGIVSTLNRTISIQSSAVPEAPAEGETNEDSSDQFNFQFPGQEQQSSSAGSIHINVMQTDAAINHGNSGGALVDVNGQIIGVNVAIASGGSGATSSGDSGSIGVGFAIPIDYAQRIAQDLIENGEASHGLLGVSVTAQPASTSGSSSFSVGAVVREVVDGSAAAEAGLTEGDVITGVDDRLVDDSLSLTAVVREYAAGETATVHYVRNGQERTADVTLGQMEGN